MDVMYSIGIGAAFVASVLGTFEFIFSSEFLFYDTVILLPSFLILGRYLEAKAKGKTSEAIKEFKNMKFNVIMITGDNAKTANAIGGEIGIENVLAEVLPQNKATQVMELQEKGEVVAFVGDGINYAPALAQANIGIAIGSGTDVAIESGEIVLIKDDLMDAVAAIQLSKKVMSRIKQNLFWAFAYNILLIPVAGGILHPVAFKPELAGLAMALSSITVVGLSLMLKNYVLPTKRVARSL